MRNRFENRMLNAFAKWKEVGSEPVVGRRDFLSDMRDVRIFDMPDVFRQLDEAIKRGGEVELDLVIGSLPKFIVNRIINQTT